MAVRSRTSLFVRFREDARRLGNGSDVRRVTAGAGSLPDRELLDMDERPAFLLLHEQLGRQLGVAEKRIAKLTELQSRRLLPGFAEENLEEQDAEIKEETEQIQREIHACEVAVRKIPAGAENKVWSNMQKTFASDLQTLSMKFRSQQKQYLKQLEKQRDLINSALIRKSEGQLVMLDDDPSLSSAGGGFTDDQMLEVQAVDMHLDERNREIERIAASIQDVASVMKDMSQLVVEQGTVLDRIDYNIEEAQGKTEDATEQLRQAERYQRRGMSFAIVMCLLIGCFVMAVTLIAKILS